MSKIKVKICGITRLSDALIAARLGADALGFVFYKKSPRYIAPGDARNIIRKIPKKVLKIGVFAGEKEKTVKNIAKLCGLDILQFHGNESLAFCRKFNGYKIIKAFRVNGPVNKDKLLKYKVFAYLFDSFSKEKMGGTGIAFNWCHLRNLKNIGKPVFLSGGLNYLNVKEAIKKAKPSWVDASSFLEKAPGIKDHRKLKAFIAAVKNN